MALASPMEYTVSVPSSMGKMGLPELSRGAREALRGAEEIAVLEVLDFFFGAPAILMNSICNT